MLVKTPKNMCARSVRPACNCKKKCIETVGVDSINNLFNAYYELNYDKQSHYIHKHVSSSKVKSVSET